jgi:hypothetical protein
MFMKIRVAFGLLTLAAGLIGGSAANAAVTTCRDEFTGDVLNANVVGTDAGETFGASRPGTSFTFTLKDGDVVQTNGGKDTVDATGLAYLTICLGDGQDKVINGEKATDPEDTGRGFSIRGGGNNDTVSGTQFLDVVNGGAGDNDIFNDPTADDGDVCRKFERLFNCEIVNPPGGAEGPE